MAPVGHLQHFQQQIMMGRYHLLLLLAGGPVLLLQRPALLTMALPAAVGVHPAPTAPPTSAAAPRCELCSDSNLAGVFSCIAPASAAAAAAVAVICICCVSGQASAHISLAQSRLLSTEEFCVVSDAACRSSMQDIHHRLQRC